MENGIACSLVDGFLISQLIMKDHIHRQNLLNKHGIPKSTLWHLKMLLKNGENSADN
jgi:hypothetical protein